MTLYSHGLLYLLDMKEKIIMPIMGDTYRAIGMSYVPIKYIQNTLVSIRNATKHAVTTFKQH